MGEADAVTMCVLVADDEPKLRALVAECVRTLGCEVIEAADGGDAWALAQSRQPDLVILDVMMPVMSGWEVCRRIKNDGKTRRGSTPKVLMLTGIGEHLNEMTSPLFAADDWLDKPFALAQLGDKVLTLCRRSLGEPPAPRPSGPDLKKARPATDAAAGRVTPSSSPPAAVAPKAKAASAKPAKAKAASAKPAKPAKAKAASAKPAKAKAANAKPAKAKPPKPAKAKAARAKAAKAKPPKPAKARAASAKAAKAKPPQPAKARAGQAQRAKGKAAKAKRARATPAGSGR